MANAKRCDRCGTYYMIKEKKASIKKKLLGRIELDDVYDFIIDAYDLCDKCSEDLIRWLNEEAQIVSLEEKKDD